MNPSVLRLFILVCATSVLCSAVGCQDNSTQTSRGGERINFFKPPPRNPDVPRQETVRSQHEIEQVSRVSDSFQRALNTPLQEQGRTLLVYGVFLGVVVFVVLGFVGLQMWWQRRLARELSDPAFLVKELNTAHQLSEQEKRFMRELSEKNFLSTPLKLFVEPGYLLEAWENESFVASKPMVRQLLNKLFDITKA